MLLCEKRDATPTASSEVLGVQTRCICPDSRQGWAHSPSYQRLNQPAINKRGPGLLEKLPTCFSAYLGHVYCHCLTCTKEALEMRAGQDGCKGSNPKPTAFFGLGCWETFQGIGHLWPFLSWELILQLLQLFKNKHSSKQNAPSRGAPQQWSKHRAAQRQEVQAAWLAAALGKTGFSLEQDHSRRICLWSTHTSPQVRPPLSCLFHGSSVGTRCSSPPPQGANPCGEEAVQKDIAPVRAKSVLGQEVSRYPPTAPDSITAALLWAVPPFPSPQLWFPWL